MSIPEYPASTLVERALDVIFPPTCVGCRRIGRWICASCWLDVYWRPDSRCATCLMPWTDSPCNRCRGLPTPIDSIDAVTEFRDVAREAVHALKYEGRHAIAPMMGRLMAGRVSTFPVDLIVPVPLHASRRRERGYDQAAMLAQRVARMLDLPYAPDLLKRTRKTRQQVSLDGEARRRNVEGAFAATWELSGETIMLVDDVYTTGATMGSAAAALKAAGAGAVHAMAFGIAVPGNDSQDS